MTTMLEAAKRHREQDLLLAGTFGETGEDGEWRGCSVGCFAHDAGITDTNEIHAAVSKHYGIPEWMIHLQDRIFEGLPAPDRYDWHVQIAEAYERVTDWPLALHRVHAAILRIAIKTAGEAHDVVAHVLHLHEQAAAGVAISVEQWAAAESAAWNEGESAAGSAAWSATWSVARSAAEFARSAAVSAAEFARYAVGLAARYAAVSAMGSARYARSARYAAYRDLRDAILPALTGDTP